MNEVIADKKALFNQLPPVPQVDLNDAIRNEIHNRYDTIIVLDDDPTGTQTVYNLPVLTSWSVAGIQQALEAATPIFYILTNSRSLTPEVADELALEIGKNIVAANRDVKKRILVISRGDSTLRGHYPSEVEALKVGLGNEIQPHVLIPAFFEGGRYTIDDIHYVHQNGNLIPAAQTSYAKDQVFGYKKSNLKEWVEEKTGGTIRASEVISFSIQALRQHSLVSLIEKLNNCPLNATCIVNAASYYDLQVFTLALLRSKIHPICRTAASFVAAIVALPPKPLLKIEELIEKTAHGGLIIIGSHVPKTTRQLQHLQATIAMNFIELDVNTLLNTQNDTVVLIKSLADRIDNLIQRGEDVVFFTSRKPIIAHSPAENIAISRQVSSALVSVVKQLTAKPKYLIAKGGITSSDIATKSLHVKRAIVKGQVLAGVPVWELDKESKHPGLSYIIFPGNVGDDDAITEVVQLLKVQKAR